MRCLAALALTLVLLLVLAGALIAFAYLEENTRGARAWEAALQDIRARGEPADFEALVPALVPDDLNLATLPLFRREPDPTSPTSVLSVGLTEALAKLDVRNDGFPKMPAMINRKSDPKAIAAYLAARYRAAFPDAKELPDTLAQFDAICPAMNDLRHAAETRTYCRFPQDYTTVPVFNRPLGPTTSMISLAKATNLHALVALQGNRPEVALGDILAALKIDEGVRQEPILVSGLVAAGVYFIQGSSLWEGLESHAWNDAQLARLQQELQKIDFLADNQLCLRGEAMAYLAGTIDYVRDHRDPKLITGLNAGNDSDHGVSDTYMGYLGEYLGELAGRLTPSGWFDLAKARAVGVDYQDAREVIDLSARRVYPDKPEIFTKKAEKGSPYSIPDILIRVATGPIFNSTCQFAHAQARVDMAAIACALERYRLAHGTFPDSLDALKPYFPDRLPLDPMSGDAYRYRLQKDGTFLLYSIGWDLKDGGGQPAFLLNKPESLDREHGDWVWPASK